MHLMNSRLLKIDKLLANKLIVLPFKCKVKLVFLFYAIIFIEYSYSVVIFVSSNSSVGLNPIYLFFYYQYILTKCYQFQNEFHFYQILYHLIKE